jgi:hypothetical protein
MLGDWLRGLESMIYEYLYSTTMSIHLKLVNVLNSVDLIIYIYKHQ